MSQLITEPFTDTLPPELAEHLPFPFENLSDFQRWAIYHLWQRHTVLITAHTGTGKTCPAQFACSYFKKTVYTGPIKALLNQKYRDFCAIFGSDRVGLVTGDIRMNPTASILITTLECYRNELVNQTMLNIDDTTSPHHKEFDLSDVDCVIFDEVHWIRDPDRGQAWQEALILTPMDITVLMLSATMSNTMAFADWISALYCKPTYVMSTTRRIVPLEFKALHPREKTLVDVNPRMWTNQWPQSTSSQIDATIAQISTNHLTPALIVSFSRDQCEQYANNNQYQFLTDADGLKVRHIWDRYMWEHTRTYGTSPQYRAIQRLVLRGVAFHHAGLIPVLKEIVEILMEQRLIHVLYATETFAVGINMPIKTVVFTSLMKPTGQDGLRLLRPDEFIQIAGRAGRRGIDTSGTVILMPTHIIQHPSDIDTMMRGHPAPIPSRFKWSIHMILQLLIKAERTGQEYLSIFKRFYAASFAYIDETDTWRRREQEYEQLTTALIEMPQPDSIAYRKLDELQMKRALLPMMSLKDRRAYERLVQSTPLLRQWDQFQDRRQRHAELHDMLIHRETAADSKINRLVTSMIRLGMLTPDMAVTSMGLIASAIQDGNELLYAMMVRRIDWSRVTVPIFGGLLSMLIDEKYSAGAAGPLVPDAMLPWLRQMQQILQSLEEQVTDASLQEFYGGYSWTLSEHYIGPMFDWLSNESFMTVIQRYPGLFEGSFIRYCLRMRQIMDMMFRVGQYLRSPSLTTLATDAIQMLIRDEVRTDSLYLVQR